MRKAIWSGAIALSLFGYGALAQTVPAQEQTAAEAQKQSFPAQPQSPSSTTAPDHTTPPPPNAQPQAPLADQAKPAAVGPAQANTAGSIQSDTPPGATAQTMPSTISKENAALDKQPITARQFPLTDEQKKLISSSVSGSKSQSSESLSKVHVAGYLPIDVMGQEFSPELKQQIPSAGRYKFVKLDRSVLIIDPVNETVVGEITQ